MGTAEPGLCPTARQWGKNSSNLVLSKLDPVLSLPAKPRGVTGIDQLRSHLVINISGHFAKEKKKMGRKKEKKERGTQKKQAAPNEHGAERESCRGRGEGW